jgi:hypothetical protein
MSYVEFLHSTPPEINIKIEAWNDARRMEKLRDYEAIKLSGWAYHDPKNFPSFTEFYPEKQPEPVKTPVPMTDSEAKQDLLSLTP